MVVPSLGYNGTSTQLRLLAAGLPRPLFQVRVAVLGPGGPGAELLRAKGIDVVALGWKRLVDLNPRRRLGQLLNAFRPDVIHAWGRLSLRILAGVDGRRHSRLIVSGLAQPHRLSSLGQHFDAWLLRGAAAVVAAGSAEAAQYRRYKIPEGKIVTVRPAVAPAAARGAHAAFCRRLGISENARLVACAGPLAPEKGFQEAIWTFEILKYLYANLHLILIGDGADRSRLEQFVRLIGAEGHVHFLGQQPDAAALLGHAEVVWVPSRRHGGVNVTLEAMAASRPVVASRVPALAELVADGQTGFLIAPGDKVALARKTRLLLDNPHHSRQMGEAGRQRSQRDFAVGQLVDRLARVYEDGGVPAKITTAQSRRGL